MTRPWASRAGSGSLFGTRASDVVLFEVLVYDGRLFDVRTSEGREMAHEIRDVTTCTDWQRSPTVHGRPGAGARWSPRSSMTFRRRRAAHRRSPASHGRAMPRRRCTSRRRRRHPRRCWVGPCWCCSDRRDADRRWALVSERLWEQRGDEARVGSAGDPARWQGRAGTGRQAARRSRGLR